MPESGVPLLPAEASELLKTLTMQTGLAQFVALLLPGLVAILVYDLRVPSEQRKYGEMVLAIVVYSGLLDLLGFAIVDLVPKTPTWALIGGVGVIVPALVGWVAVDAREWLSRQGYALSPFPMAWDQLFRRLGASKELYALIFTMSDGRKVGGIYDSTSFASTYPAEGDVLIGAPCEYDKETGLFLHRIKTSYGLYIKRADVLAIEVRELKSAFKAKPQATAKEGDHGRAADPEMDPPTGGSAGP